MSFYVVPKNKENKKHFASTWPMDLTMSSKVRLQQEVFNYMCECFNIKIPCIHLLDAYKVTDS